MAPPVKLGGSKPHLPEHSLRANILLGKPQATDNELQRAVERAHVHEFLPQLPQGWIRPSATARRVSPWDRRSEWRLPGR